ncbi:MAG: AAA family ATPase [Oscillospiraceae bacterium]|jgi:Septum formation inhibitor-activating ATPase|nr:AAA family ATPase [Oscillospiraceae bacterium]MBQ4240490.1 AAA family ATPase [Oscillospiraceae bacterium]
MSTITRVLSGKDGVGKSTVTALIGEQLALSGRKVLLIEFENGLRTLDMYVGATQTKIYDLDDVLNGRCEIADAIANSSLSRNLDVIFAGNVRKDLPKDQFEDMVLALNENYDHIIIDTDCSEESLDCITGITMNNLVVATQDIPGIRDARYVCDRLLSAGCVGVKVIFNRVNSDYIAKKITPNLDTAMDLIGVPLFGVIPENGDILNITARGILPKSKTITKDIAKALASRLEGETVPLTVL